MIGRIFADRRRLAILRARRPPPPRCSSRSSRRWWRPSAGSPSRSWLAIADRRPAGARRTGRRVRHRSGPAGLRLRALRDARSRRHRGDAVRQADPRRSERPARADRRRPAVVGHVPRAPARAGDRRAHDPGPPADAIVFAGGGACSPTSARRRGRPRSCSSRSWPRPLAIRAAEARGPLGVEAVGQSLLHVLVVVQVGARGVAAQRLSSA